MQTLLGTLISETFISGGHFNGWQADEFVWLNVISNLLIALAYYSILALLIYINPHRKNQFLQGIFWLFGAFIVSCGTTHLIEVWMLWHQTDWLSGFVKLISTVFSGVAAVALMLLIPKAFDFQNSDRAAIGLHLFAESTLQQSDRELETRVQERTDELQHANQQLLIKIVERQQVEEALKESEERFRTSIENMLDCFGIYTAIRDINNKIIDFSVEYVNQAACTNNLITKENYIGKRLCELLPAYRETGLFEEYCQVVETGKPLAKESIFYEDVFEGQRISKVYEIRAVKLGDGFTAAWRDIAERKQAEAALYQREREFKALVENAPDMIVRFDRQLRHLYVNPAVERATGIPAESFIGKTNLELGMSDEIVAEWNQNLYDVFANGLEKQIEYQFSMPWGVTWYQSRIVPELASDGSVESLLAITRDITKRKNIEKALQESEERYRRIIETATEGIWIIDARGYTTFANQKIAEMLGYTVEEMVGMPLSAFMDLESQAIAEINLERRRSGITEQHDFKFIRPDGSELWTIIASSPIFDSAGQYAGALGMLTDITKRKKAEEERDRAFNLSQDMLCIAGFDGYFKQVNPAFEKALGWTAEELKAKPFIEFIHAEDRELTIEAGQKIVKGIEIASYENRYLCKDGSYKWLMWKATPLSDLEISYAVAYDITDRKRSEEALSESEERFRQLAENIDRIFTIRALEDRRMLYISPAYEQIFGRSCQSLYDDPQSWQEAVHPEDREVLAIAMEKVYGGEYYFQYEYRIVRPDGEERWIGSRMFPIQNEVGQIYRLAGIAEDITDRKLTEKTLQQSEQHLQTVLENMPVMMNAVDTEGNFIFWNRECERVTGYAASEIVGNERAFELLYTNADYRAAIAIEWRQRVQNYRNWEWQLAAKDGTVKTVSWSSISEEFPIPGWASWGIGTDVTERKQAVAELVKLIASFKESEQRFRAIAEVAPIPVLICRNSDGQLLYANAAASQMMGLSLETMNRLQALDFYYNPADRQIVLDILKRDGLVRNYEVRAKKGDGTPYWISLSVELLTFNGEPASMAVSYDITERKQKEVARDRELQQLRQIVTRVPAAMAMLDKEMRYVAHSEKWLVDYGWQGQSIIGRSYYEIFPDIPQKWKEIHQRALAGEVISADEDVWERADGSTIYERWAIQPWYAINGKIGGIVIVTQRINELVEAREAALAAARYKSQFLANMSHEIRTPMNGVLGMVGLLLKTQLTAQQRDYAQTIRISADHLLTVIDDILDFSKLEAGEMQLEVLDFDLNECLEDVVNLLAAQAETKGIELAILIDSNVPKQVQGDPGRLRQILLNLASNAIKFTAAGEVVVQATCLAQTRSVATIRFAIRDTGIGISVENQTKLFQSFSQVDASTTRQYGGTGLGLAICKQLVELMGGEIGVESQLGQGSTFWFTVKLGKQKATAMPIVPLDLKAMRLLLVDESATTRQSVRSMVSAWGMHIDEAANVTEALAIWRSRVEGGQVYDLAIFDLQLLLKGEEGREKGEGKREKGEGETNDFSGVFREFSFLISSTKLILITTLKQQEIAEQMMGSGFQGYVVKPVRASRLFDSLLTAIAPVHSTSSFDIPELPPNSETLIANPHALKILLAEDHPINQQVLLEQLKLLGYAADWAENGQVALNMLAIQNYDIVLMDCQMPVLDGYATTQELRHRESTQRHTIVIALTAHAMPADRDKCLAAGMDDYISKPVDLEALSQVLERWANNRSIGNISPLLPFSPSPAPPLPSSLPPLDLERLHNISRGRVEFQKKLMRAFVEAIRSDFTAIQIALETNDRVAIEQLAHRLKGAAANVGANPLSAIASQLELLASDSLRDSYATLGGSRFASTGAIVDASKLLVALSTQIELVISFIENRFSQ